MVYLSTRYFLLDWIYVRDILLVKSEVTTVVLGGRVLPAPMGWVIPIYENTSASMMRWCMDATDMG